MKIKKIIDGFRKSGSVTLLNKREEDGETVEQWITDGNAAYPLYHFPTLTAADVQKIYEIDEKKVNVREEDMPESLLNAVAKAPVAEDVEPEALGISFRGYDVTPFMTSEGLKFYSTRYLDPLELKPETTLYKRVGDFLVISTGITVVCAVMPYKVITEEFCENLRKVFDQCQTALENERDIT